MEVTLLETIQHKYDLGSWMRTENFGCILLQKGVRHMMERTNVAFPVEPRGRCGFLCPLWCIFFWHGWFSDQKKIKILSPLSKYRLSNCNLLVCCCSKEMEIYCLGASYGCVLPSFSSSSSPPLSQAVTWYVDHPHKCVQIHYFPLQS